MHPLATNPPRALLDDLRIIFEPAGATGLSNESSGFAALPAPYINFAEPRLHVPTCHCSTSGGRS